MNSENMQTDEDDATMLELAAADILLMKEIKEEMPATTTSNCINEVTGDKDRLNFLGSCNQFLLPFAFV